MNSTKKELEKLFNKIKSDILSIDPVYWVEKYLTLDGHPFRLNGTGYKPFCDIYRYIGVKALDRAHGKPIVISKGRQVGATTMAAALELYFMASGLFGKNNRPPMRIMHAFPQLNFVYAYSKTKLNPLITQAVSIEEIKGSAKPKSFLQNLLDKGKSSDALEFKQFEGGNHVWIDSIGLDADRIRGRTVDAMFFDEVQDMYDEALGNAVKILSQSQYGKRGEGIQVYFGTPKLKGSAFWRIWNKSSQQYYHLGCGKCGDYFPLYTPGSNEWENIWLYQYTVRCTKCGYEQDKLQAAERGKWIASKDPDECDFVGFHINQLYMPNFDKETILKQKPERHPTNTEKLYQNEILGEFFQGDSTIITPEQLIEKCGDRKRHFKARISPGEEEFVALGIDIGDKNDLEQLSNKASAAQGQSYSVAVVLTLKGPKLLSVDFATKFKRNDPESKKSFIEECIRKYSPDLVVCDIGHASDLVSKLQTQYGDKFLASRAGGKVNNHIKFSEDVFPKEIMFEKDHFIGEVYEQFRQGNIRFPLGDYDLIAWLVNHCTSMEIKPTYKNGEITPHYVKGGAPNDGFMALINAYIAYKFWLTNGFKIKNPNAKDSPANKGIPAVTGYVPWFR